MFHAPEEVSFDAVGVATTVGVYVDDATWFSESETWYVTGVAVPVKLFVGTKVITPVVWLTL
jgi:hypothetical protein